MSSLASLAQHAAPQLTAAQIAFYAAGATVIPVLYLALAVQGNFYERLLQTGTATALAPGWGPLAILRSRGGAIFAFSVALLILVYGVVGEILAVNDKGYLLELILVLAITMPAAFAAFFVAVIAFM